MERQNYMGLLARASEGHLLDAVAKLPHAPKFSFLRQPEIGSVMVRARQGGTGASFNMGEMTVTRCSLRLETGEVGHGYVQGRATDKATKAALVDAMMQTANAAEIIRLVLDPLAMIETERRNSRAAKAAGTKVEFFTMAREN
ncbi:MAG: phosphonate C-P lyase system protein PhnG [Mangrovicoccus sp.]